MTVGAVGSAGTAAPPSPLAVGAALAVLGQPTDATTLGPQLEAYGALAGRWRGAQGSERSALAEGLTDSPFGQRVTSTLDAYTRAAWAGPEAVPPAPQQRALQAFNDLNPADQQIVAYVQGGRAGETPDAAAARYRDRLQADVDAATADEAAPARRPDSVTLSSGAQARLAGPQVPVAANLDPPPVQPRSREIAAALAAYARVAGE